MDISCRCLLPHTRGRCCTGRLNQIFFIFFYFFYACFYIQLLITDTVKSFRSRSLNFMLVVWSLTYLFIQKICFVLFFCARYRNRVLPILQWEVYSTLYKSRGRMSSARALQDDLQQATGVNVSDQTIHWLHLCITKIPKNHQKKLEIIIRDQNSFCIRL